MRYITKTLMLANDTIQNVMEYSGFLSVKCMLAFDVADCISKKRICIAPKIVRGDLL